MSPEGTPVSLFAHSNAVSHQGFTRGRLSTFEVKEEEGIKGQKGLPAKDLAFLISCMVTTVDMVP